ncbi:MAG: DUF1631 family protein [Rhodoferax sp.]|nr:DUF1631 family protein [Rhodoferax sp.]
MISHCSVYCFLSSSGSCSRPSNRPSNRKSNRQPRERDKESLDAALAHATTRWCTPASPPCPATLPLAPFLTPFCRPQWREVIAHAWLDAETRPGHWEAALATMDLFDFGAPSHKTHADERWKLVGVLPDLVRSINANLDSINWTGDERATFCAAPDCHTCWQSG